MKKKIHLNKTKMADFIQEVFVLGAVYAYFCVDPFLGWCFLLISLLWKKGGEGFHETLTGKDGNKILLFAIISVVLAWAAAKINI